MNWWVTIYRLAWAALLVLFAVGAICAFLPKCRKLSDLQERKSVLRQQNRQTEAAIRELKAKQQRFRTDMGFVERTARESGLVKTNETVFKFE